MQKGNIGVTTENIFPVIKKFLYSDHEIFLREMVSNAVDATQKMKTLAEKGEFKGELGDLTVRIAVDKEAKTITISDRGIGMTEEEIDKYINQIAFSGVNDFLEKYKDNANNIIGHFGLGFYSSFMVSDRVEIITRSYREGAKAVKWSCDGSPSYEIDDAEKADRGSDIVLHVSEDCSEYLEKATIEGLLNKYCKFMAVPVAFGKKTEWKDGKYVDTEEDNIINKVEPLWTKTPSTLKEEDYKSFYRTLYPMHDEPMFWIHLNVDYPFNLTGILYFPRIKSNIDLQRNKIQLYCNQVFVTDQVEGIVPEFLTLLHGVIDSPDIPLNVSRSYLQSDRDVKKISTYITKKVSDRMQGGVETIKPYVDQFIDFAKQHTELFFYVTRIGCGIAGFKDRDIAPLFKDAMGISNVCLPETFIEENKNAVSPEVPQELLTMMYGQVRTLIDLLIALNKQKPIKDSDDARERLTEIAERNVRYGDEFAFMAMRTIWCIMSRYEHEGSKVDIEQLEKDMLSFHDGNEYLKANHIEQIFYNYSVRKMVKYIQFLNEFRRYSDYESIREDLQSIPVSHCSSNDPQYYYSFYKGTLFNVWHILLAEWDNVTKNGKLDNDLLEQVAFGRFDNMVKEHGLKETIRLAYGEVGCHPDIQAPRMREEGRVWGPVYRIDGKHIEKGCSDFRRWPWTNTSFEMKFAREVLERDKNYMCVDTDWRGALYLPLSDYTLPVYSLQLGKMHFESQEEKIKFIEDHKTGRNAD